MKNDLQNFEENLKKKLEEYEFPFDEKNWEKASAMIDASRNNRRPFMFYFLSGLALLLVSTGLIYFMTNTISASDKKLLAVNEHAAVIKEHTPVVNTDNTPLVQNQISNTSVSSSSDIKADNTTQNSEIKPILSKQVTTIKKPSVISASKNAVSLVKPSDTKTVSQTVNSTASDEIANNSNTSNLSTNAAQSTHNAANTSNASSNSTGKQSESSLTKKTEKPKGSVTTEIPAVLGSNLNNNQPRNTIADSPSLTNENSNKLGNIITPVNTPQVSASQTTDSVGAVVTLSSNTLIVSVVDSLNTADVIKTDSATGSPIVTERPYKVKPTKNYLYADIGANYLFGWNTNNGNEANGFNIAGGLNYQYYFNPTISMALGIQYNSIGNLTNSSYSVTTLKYDFGVQKDVTEIKYIRLHYLTLPVKLGFNIGKHHIIGFGANVSTLINSDSQTDKYHTNNAEPVNESNRLSSTKETGYLTGFNPYDVQAGVFYRVKVYKGFSIGAELYYGLTDIKENNHFKNNNFERATGAKITIGYDLFKK